MIQLVPALSLLLTFLIVTLIILAKVKPGDLPKLLETPNVLLLFAAGLFCTLLVVHLFKEQSWTADLLKVVGGVLGGAVATLSGAKQAEAGGISQTAIGSQIQQAARDINNIRSMVGDLQKVSNSVINQFQAVRRSVADASASASGGSRAAVLSYSPRIEVRDETPEFVERLNAIRGRQDEKKDWAANYIHECLKNVEIQRQLADRIREFEAEGWTVRSMSYHEPSMFAGLVLDVELGLETPLQSEPPNPAMEPTTRT